MKRSRVLEEKIYPMQETLNRIFESLSKKQIDKITKLRVATWNDNGKTYGPMSDQQIAWAVKLPLPVIQIIK